MASNGTRRQSRLSIPVTKEEKRRARALAHKEKTDISKLVRRLLAERHRRRREDSIIAEASAGKPGSPPKIAPPRKRKHKRLTQGSLADVKVGNGSGE
jgi:hypothetical protein